MAQVIQLDIVSAESTLFSGEVASLSATGSLGELGIMPGHTPLVTSLKPGSIKAKTTDGQEQDFYISGGTLEVQPKHVTVLADTAIRADQLDENAAMAARRAALVKIEQKGSDFDYSAALSELAQAAAQLRLLEKFKQKGRQKGR